MRVSDEVVLAALHARLERDSVNCSSKQPFKTAFVLSSVESDALLALLREPRRARCNCGNEEGLHKVQCISLYTIQHIADSLARVDKTNLDLTNERHALTQRLDAATNQKEKWGNST